MSYQPQDFEPVKIRQYCRYCANACPYEPGFVCEADAPCGNFGAGKEYSTDKAKRMNHCKSFEYNGLDILRDCDGRGRFAQYKPRIRLVPDNIPKLEQFKL
jgi:hypothetical protein